MGKVIGVWSLGISLTPESLFIFLPAERLSRSWPSLPASVLHFKSLFSTATSIHASSSFLGHSIHVQEDRPTCQVCGYFFIQKYFQILFNTTCTEEISIEISTEIDTGYRTVCYWTDCFPGKHVIGLKTCILLVFLFTQFQLCFKNLLFKLIYPKKDIDSMLLQNHLYPGWLVGWLVSL